MMYLKIKPLTDDSINLYSNHSHYHTGDCGLDIFFSRHNNYSTRWNCLY